MPSRHLIGVISCLACIVVVAAGKVSPATIFHDDPRAQKPYNGSPEDRRLMAFDQSHPNCAMWTDWRKLCERLGPGHKTVCGTDPSHPVPPSTPFCERETGYTMFRGEDGPKSETRAERQSRVRFSYTAKYLIGRAWRSNRPFNGGAPKGLSYSGCHVWSYEDKVGRSETCATDGRAGMTSCTRAASAPADGNAVCLEVRAHDPCDPLWSKGASEVIKPYSSEEKKEFEALGESKETEILSAYSPTAFPVYGFKCPVMK